MSGECEGEIATSREANTRLTEQCTAYAAECDRLRREKDDAWQKWQRAEAQLRAALALCDEFEQADTATQGPSPRVTIQRVRDVLREGT